MRILSKSITPATTLVFALLTASCARFLPWRGHPATPEINLVEMQTLRINERPGRFLLGSAAPRTVLDPAYAGKGPHALQLNEKETIRISPATLDLRGVADGIIGADAWRNRAISIDYKTGLVTYQKLGIERGLT